MKFLALWLTFIANNTDVFTVAKLRRHYFHMHFAEFFPAPLASATLVHAPEAGDSAAPAAFLARAVEFHVHDIILPVFDSIQYPFLLRTFDILLEAVLVICISFENVYF